MFAALSWVCQKQRTDWGVQYLLMDLCACVGVGPSIKFFVMGCVQCVAERGCGAGVVYTLRSWAYFVGFGCLRDLGASLREPMC